MSRLFRNRLRIGLAPDRMLLAVRRRGLRRRPDERDSMSIGAPGNPADWRPAVDALPAAIALSELRRPDVEVVLSNHFVHYAFLPWNDALAGDEEWLALARHRLQSIHGGPPESWTLRVSATASRGARIACAVETELLAALRSTLDECGARLASAQPNLMATFNALRRELRREDCWLAVKETGRLTLALLEKGTWRALRSRRIDDGRGMPLHEILEREAAMLALAEPYTRRVLFVPDDFAVSGEDLLRITDWTLAGEGGDGEPSIAAAAAEPVLAAGR